MASALSVYSLKIDDVVAVARDGAEVKPLDPNDNDDYIKRIRESAAWVQATMHDVEEAAREGREPTAYYGINTGFGDNSGRSAFKSIDEAERLSRKLLLSHMVGVGTPFAEDVVRAALLIRIASLAKGYSGVRIEVINTLIELLNKRVYPVVPCQGSLGASGDLAPLAHLVIPISAPLPDEDPDQPGATGYCFLNGKIVTGAEAMAAAGIPQIRLGAKEGVALINGTAVSLAISVLATFDALHLLRVSELAVAMVVDALRGFRDPFLPQINQLRQPSQEGVGQTILGYLKNSTLARGDAAIDLTAADNPPQDAYSIRCAPAVIGAVRNTTSHINNVLMFELMAVTDNPLIFASDDPDAKDYLPRQTKVISGGNFHGAPIGYAMDFLSIAIADLASISERRTFMMLDPRLNRGLPPFLIPDPPDEIGLDSGLMIAQYTAAALVSENKTLAHPASVDSIPSSANREDHVSMSTIAARKAAQMVTNARKVVAIELLCAAQALRLRLEASPDWRPGEGTQRALDFIYNLDIGPGHKFEVIRKDTPLLPYIDALSEVIQSGALISYVIQQ